MNLTPLIGILVGPASRFISGSDCQHSLSSSRSRRLGDDRGKPACQLVEVVVAYTLFQALKKIFASAFARGGIATVTSLLCGNLVMIIIILVSEIQGVTQTKTQILAGLSLLAGINMIVAIIEAVITGMIIAYMVRVRPDMLEREQSKKG